MTDAPGPVSALVAVEYLGYWGLAAINVGGSDFGADDALDRAATALRPGRRGADAVLAAGDEAARLLVNGIGCAPAEAPYAEADRFAVGDV